MSAFVASASAQAAQPQAPSENQLELRFAEGLRRLGLPDYAELVLSRISTGPQEELLKLQICLSRGDFEKAKSIIAAKPNQDSEEAWALKLSLADAYYAWGKYQEAKAIYDSFFKKFGGDPPANIAEFYVKSAYKFGQMLVLMGQPKAALGIYKKALGVVKVPHVQRQLKAEIAELMLKMAEEDPAQKQSYVSEAGKICDELLWNQDIWFGKAIVMKAHVKVLNGDTDGAMNLVEDYMPQLKAIHSTLEQEAREQNNEDLIRMSPLPHCRYLMGVVLQKEAQKLIDSKGDRAKIADLLTGKKDPKGRMQSGAFQHFVNVFARYPMSPWAPDAGARVKQVQEMAAKVGKTPFYRLSEEQSNEIERQQFQSAKALFNQQQWQAAADAYLKVLAVFPEGERSLAGLADLCRCYVELNDDLYTDMVLRYLAERFSGREAYVNPAGNKLLGLYQTFVERKMMERANQAQQLFLTHFTRHPQAAVLLFRSGEQKFSAKEYPGALKIYQQVTNQFPNSPLYAEALSRMASCYRGAGDRASEMKTLEYFIKVLEGRSYPGHPLIVARYHLAGAYREMGEKSLPAAINRYAEIVKLLDGNPGKYGKTVEEEKSNQAILEAAVYYGAVSYARLPPSGEAPENEYKKQAVKALEAFVGRFPKSQLAPEALSQIGTLYTILQNADEAKKAFDRLQKDFPASQQAKNAKFYLAMSLMKLDRKTEARKLLMEMFDADKGGLYSDVQIQAAGNELLKVKEYEIAAKAFDRLLASARDRSLREPALAGKGRALIELGKLDEGAKVLESLLNEYKNSGYTVDVCMALAKAYSSQAEKESDELRRVNLFNGGMKAMKKARQYLQLSNSKRGLAESDLEIARMYERMAKAEDKFSSPAAAAEDRGKAAATYQILVMRDVASEPETLPVVELGYTECIPLLLQLERWQDVKENCEEYLRMFPAGPNKPAVSTWLNKAEGKLGAQGARPARPAGASEEQP